MDALMKIDGDKVRIQRERKRALGLVGALAGITAGVIGVLNERSQRRQNSA
jgi:hypothetical protein